ncbi:hypothetical protein GCM10020256_42750 [Streptomyces thermocoprophilus]
MSLAIGSYEKLRGLDDGADLLNLAWTQDEREHLSADVMAVVAEELAAELAEDLPYIGDYMVKDPYGEHLLGPAVAEYFGRPGWDASVTCGAGVGPLLHDLALLAAAPPWRSSPTSTPTSRTGPAAPEAAASRPAPHRTPASCCWNAPRSPTAATPPSTRCASCATPPAGAAPSSSSTSPTPTTSRPPTAPPTSPPRCPT